MILDIFLTCSCNEVDCEVIVACDILTQQVHKQKWRTGRQGDEQESAVKCMGVCSSAWTLSCVTISKNVEELSVFCVIHNILTQNVLAANTAISCPSASVGHVHQTPS